MEAAYKQWKEGFGDLSWKTYLLRISKNPYTGKWAKEVAVLLAKEKSGDLEPGRGVNLPAGP